MGQQHFSQLHHYLTLHPPSPSQETQSPEQFLASILKLSSQVANRSLTPQDLSQHLLTYLNTQLPQNNNPRKRRRSYELLQMEQKTMEEDAIKSQTLTRQCQALQQRMQWLEQIQEAVRQNITDVMVTQKTYKIRQNFRKLALQLLRIQNVYIYILHPQGRLEYHDFKSNYISDILQTDKVKSIQDIIRQYKQETVTLQALSAFDLAQEAQGQEDLFRWGVSKDSNKLNICYLWKGRSGSEVPFVCKKIAQKITNIAMISTSQQENSIIQTYSKDLLQFLQLCIYACEIQTCRQIGSTFCNLEQTEQDLQGRNEKDEPLIARISSYQQLQFQLLERIRMYKKYACEGDKIFMDFNESAELTFISHNFTHPLSSNLPKLFQHHNLFLQKIFQNFKPINDFLKKAVQKKVKHSKLYQLDFQTKARVKYDEEGRIIRLNVILQQLQKSSNGSSSSNIYCSSSTKILSQESQKPSFKQLPQNSQKSQRQSRKSALMRNLQKQNPGIINQGWINLFIKDHHVSSNTRKNTHLKGKVGKTFTVKRSFSLNREASTEPIDPNDPKNKVMSINVESIDLNLLQLEDQFLEPLVLKVFRKLEYFHSDHVNKEYFQNFLSDVHNGYQVHNNPFHNFTHGVNVMHTCYLLSSTAKVRHLLTPFKIFSLVFSGLCHDIGHTGFTNLFEIASRSKKAITYNDNSPLENFHAACTFQLLKKPENSFLKDLSAEQSRDFRKSVINNILFTDIKEHFPLLKKFNALIKDQLPKNEEYNSILSAMLVHTADFGGSAKDFQICKAWSLKVNLEFSNQYRMEGELSLPQTSYMKDLNNISILSKNQGGFLKVIVFPLFQAVDQFCGSDMRVRKLREYVQDNIKRWEEIYLGTQNEEKGPCLTLQGH